MIWVASAALYKPHAPTLRVGFLKKALDVVFFPELWDVRTELELSKPG